MPGPLVFSFVGSTSDSMADRGVLGGPGPVRIGVSTVVWFASPSWP